MMNKLIIVVAVICSHSLFAACPSQSKTVFNCTTTNNKVIQVCDAGNMISYSFGKANATPELAITVPRNKVTTYQWQGIGRYENYAINIPNGKTIYRVNDSLDKMSQQYTAGVEVSNNDKLLATVECAANKKITSKIQGIKLRPEM
jgi:predicted helicase